MTNIKLPAGYEDWVEIDFQPGADGIFYLEVGGVRHCRAAGDNSTKVTPISRPRYFVPPKPKPELPDVRTGAVLRFRSRVGSMRTAILGRTGWRVFDGGYPVTYNVRSFSDPTGTDAELLHDVDADGFTVLVPGE